ncbi:MAG: acyltransferase [Halofilum sp. (in: g-proteobacteria)]
MLAEIGSRIRRRETPFYDWLYRTAKRLRALDMPPVRAIYGPLRSEREVRRTAWAGLTRFLYHEPIFRTYCAQCGKGLHLIGGIPQVFGDLRLEVGDHVTMHGVSTFEAGKVAAQPTLAIGDHSHLGYQLTISVGARVDIGRHVLIATRVALIGYDSHPLDAVKRIRNEPPDVGGAESISIGDYAWLGMDVLVLKGVTIGEGAVIGAGSVVTRDIPPYTLAAGQPARVVRNLGPDSAKEASCG